MGKCKYNYAPGEDLRGCRHDKEMPRLDFRTLRDAIIEHDDIEALLEKGVDLVGIRIGRNKK